MNITIRYGIAGSSAREIAGNVEAALSAGRVMPGQTLPPIRSLAAHLGVSPTTVAAAYRQLARRGIVRGAGRAGTRVRANPPGLAHLHTEVPAGVRDLRGGGPDPALLPPLPPLVASNRLYGEPAVSPRLATVAVDRLACEGIDASHLAVVAGALDGVERVLGAWLRPGDRVAVEDPGYSAALDLLAALDLEVVPVAIDARGALPESLADALTRGVQAVLLTPRAQNPSGTAWDGPRAADLAAVLAGHPEALLVEDDHAGPAAGVAARTLSRPRVRWATIRSVSKWLGPDLRLAVVAGDAMTVARVERRQALGPGWVSYVLQDVVAGLWADPATTGLLARAATIYAARRAALHRALELHDLHATGSSGLTAWVSVADEHGVLAALLHQGWAVSPGEHFRIASAPGIRIAFSTLDEAEAPAFARALAHILEQRPVRAG